MAPSRPDAAAIRPSQIINMKYESIDDIYSTNARVRERFLYVVGSITPAEASSVPEGGKWSIEKLVEHVAIVEEAMAKVCAKLVAGAREAGMPNDGMFELSDDFAAKTSAVAGVQVEAPDRVHPAGGVPIADSLAKLAATSAEIDAIRGDMSLFEGTKHKFPHPLFGDLTAAEWMVIRGGHENRHTDQIERLSTAIRTS